MAETFVHNPFTGLRPADCVILFHIVILQGSDVMVAFVFAFIGKDAEDFTGCIERGQAGNGEFKVAIFWPPSWILRTMSTGIPWSLKYLPVPSVAMM